MRTTAHRTLTGRARSNVSRIVRSSGYPAPWLVVRPTSIWGPWFDAPYRDFFRAVARRHYRHPRGLQIRKSFGYVENTVHQIIQLLIAARTMTGRVFYLADYETLEVQAWATSISRAMGLPASPHYVPVGSQGVGAGG